MASTHLIVEEGPDKGREITVPHQNGIRLGRSSKNDVALNDPSVSRFHCRVFFKNRESLWVSDLGSVNKTVVNDKPCDEIQVTPGDRITIGDTTLKVLPFSGREPDPTIIMTADETAQIEDDQDEDDSPTLDSPNLDLGLSSVLQAQGPGRPSRTLIMLSAVVLAVIAVAAVWVPRLLKPDSAKETPEQTAQKIKEQAFDANTVAIRFEKVDGSSDNIFRFFFTVKDGQASVQVDDLKHDRHYSKPPIEIDIERIKELAAIFEDSTFFELDELYKARSRNSYLLRDFQVTIGTKTHSVKVVNDIEPPELEEIRIILEEFAMNEFGIRALSLPPEELINLARNSYLLAKKLYDEKNVSYENLFMATRSCREAKIYLETIDPKPAFYQDTADMQRAYDAELKLTYEDLRFEADRAMKLPDWKEASRVLQIIRATVPDRNHPWNKQAEIQLLDVQKRIER